MTRSIDGPVNLTDEQLDTVTGGTIRNPQEAFGDNQRNALEDEMWSLVQANQNKPDSTILLAAGSKEAQALTSRLWNQPDLVFDINQASSNGYTKGELAQLVQGMNLVDETINQRGGSQVTKRDGLESEIWTMINPHRGKPEDTVIVAAGSQEYKDLTAKLSNHLDTTQNVADFGKNGFTVAELTKIAQEMEMTDSMLSRRGIRTGQ